MHKSQSLFYLTNALHVSGVTTTHLQKHNSLLSESVQFGSGTYPRPHLKGTRGSSHISKAAGARSWRLLSGDSVTNAWSDTSTFRYVVRN